MAAKKRRRKAKSIKEQIAERLRDAREDAELTQMELAKKASVGRSTIMHYENAKAVPGGMELLKLSKALDVSVNHILTGKERYRKSTEEELSFDSPEALRLQFLVMFSITALEPDLRDKFAELLMGMARQRIGQEDFNALERISGALAESVQNAMPDFMNVFDNHFQEGGFSSFEEAIKELEEEA